MESLGDALIKAFRELGLEKKVKQGILISNWPDIVGQQIAQVTKAEKVEDGILIVKCNHSVWRNELYFQKKVLIKKLNKIAGEKLIRDIRFY